MHLSASFCGFLSTSVPKKKPHRPPCPAKRFCLLLPITVHRKLLAISNGFSKALWAIEIGCTEPEPEALFFFLAKRSIIANSFCSCRSRLIMMSVSSLFIFAQCLFIDQTRAFLEELFCSNKVLSSDWNGGYFKRWTRSIGNNKSLVGKRAGDIDAI